MADLKQKQYQDTYKARFPERSKRTQLMSNGRRRAALLARRMKFYVIQSGRCPVCTEDLDGLRMVLDHDHACCDTVTESSCGRCDRGVLHNRCNGWILSAIESPHYHRALTYLGYAEASEN